MNGLELAIVAPPTSYVDEYRRAGKVTPETVSNQQAQAAHRGEAAIRFAEAPAEMPLPPDATKPWLGMPNFEPGYN